jgi:S1-C subfamily serine protease
LTGSTAGVFAIVLLASCIAGAASAVTRACRLDPRWCSAEDLCSSEILGKFGELGFSYPKHVDYAKKLGLSCAPKTKLPSRVVTKDRMREGFLGLTVENRTLAQTNLKHLGLYHSAIDGYYGKGTSNALSAYNKQYLNGSDITKPEIVKNLLSAVLSVEVAKPTPSVPKDAKPQADEVLEASSGSGFAVSSDGYVVTNNHVIAGCQEVAVHDNGRVVPVTVVTYDLQNDLALLKGDFTPKAVFALSDDRPELLQDVYVAGYPFGNEISSSIKVTKGIISSLTGIGNNFSNIQIDAALQVGNSGGPILDEMGNVVGVAVSKLDAKYMYDNFGTIPENTNFGIKASVVRSVLDSNGVSSQSPSTNEITKSELGSMITGGTYYVSCLMTLSQIEVLKTKKVMFENLD